LTDEPVFSLRGVSKHYSAGGTEFRLNIPELDIPRGIKLAIIGESGSGKSTLLELLTLLLRPTECESFRFNPVADADGHDIRALWNAEAADQLADLRSNHVGYVVQSGGLLPYLTIRDNINLSLKLLQKPLGGVAEKLAGLLEIGAQLDKLPAMLSVGQYQRATIARALAHEPVILVADEPTAAVDPINADRILSMLTELTDEFGVTLLMATHHLGQVEKLGIDSIECGFEIRDGRTMIASFPPIKVSR
jgi:putative ABC transport system ATP-binding protein